MPPRRQLPWATKGGNKDNVKLPPAKRSVPSDIDDDFFNGTVLESSRKGRDRTNAEVLDVELPEVSSKSAPLKRKDRESSRATRMLSSSPPPVAAELPPPKTEYMLTGVDKFDLRDDEWMMVEDELLQTAKLFTQHLHLAEYETLKAKMEELKKEATARPVVANAKPSVEGHFKRKAQEQAKKQKRAFREVVSARDSSREGDEEPQQVVTNKSTPCYTPARGPARPMNAATALATSRPLQISRDVSNDNASDSDDLDATKRRLQTKLSAIPPKSADEGPTQAPKASVKPMIPSKAPSRPARGQRRNLWDDWDELTAKPKTSIPAPSPSRTTYRDLSPKKAAELSATWQLSSPSNSSRTSITKRTENRTSLSSKHLATTFDDANPNTPKRNPIVKDTTARPAKRKADKDEDDKKKQKYDDIPTFLF